MKLITLDGPMTPEIAKKKNLDNFFKFALQEPLKSAKMAGS